MVFGQSIGKARRENLSNLIGKLKAGSETKKKVKNNIFVKLIATGKPK